MFVFLVKRDGCIIRFSLSELFLKHASDIRYNVPRIHKGWPLGGVHVGCRGSWLEKYSFARYSTGASHDRLIFQKKTTLEFCRSPLWSFLTAPVIRWDELLSSRVHWVFCSPVRPLFTPSFADVRQSHSTELTQQIAGIGNHMGRASNTQDCVPLLRDDHQLPHRDY